MSDLILPGEAPKPAGGLTIHVPSEYADEREAPGFVCKVIVDHDKRLMCGRKYGPGQQGAFERHTGKCARKHLAEIKKAALAHRVPIMDPQSWDPEVEEHMAAVGRRMLREGRLTVNPSERAGF